MDEKAPQPEGYYLQRPQHHGTPVVVGDADAFAPPEVPPVGTEVAASAVAQHNIPLPSGGAPQHLERRRVADEGQLRGEHGTGGATGARQAVRGAEISVVVAAEHDGVLGFGVGD